MTPHEIKHPAQYFDFSIESIALVLSRLPRFCGHGDGELSVAHHLVHCYKLARILYPEDRRLHQLVLYHDVPEVFYGDIPSYVKHALGEEALSYLGKLDRDIFSKLGIPYYGGDEKRRVKLIDTLALVREAEFVFDNFVPDDWPYPEVEVKLSFMDSGFTRSMISIQYEIEELLKEYANV